MSWAPGKQNRDPHLQVLLHSATKGQKLHRLALSCPLYASFLFVCIFFSLFLLPVFGYIYTVLYVHILHYMRMYQSMFTNVCVYVCYHDPPLLDYGLCRHHSWIASIIGLWVSSMSHSSKRITFRWLADIIHLLLRHCVMYCSNTSDSRAYLSELSNSRADCFWINHTDKMLGLHKQKSPCTYPYIHMYNVYCMLACTYKHVGLFFLFLFSPCHHHSCSLIF